MARTGSTLLFILLVTGLAFLANAPSFSEAAVSVTAALDHNQVAFGGIFSLTLNVTDDQETQVGEPRLPPLEGIDLVDDQQSSQVQSSIVQGRFKVRRVQQFIYRFQVTTPRGPIKIGPIEVTVNGKSYWTEPLELKISQKSQDVVPDASTPAPSIPFDEDDLFAQLLNRNLKRRGVPGAGSPNLNIQQPFQIIVEISKNQIHVGEELVVTWYLFTQGRIVEFDALNYPSLQGFWKEDIEMPTRLNFEPEVRDGIVFNKYLLMRYALFPMKPGRAVIDPLRVKSKIYFGFGAGENIENTRASPELPIEVLALPEGGRSSLFSGGVGEFTVTALLNSSQPLYAQEPFVIKVRVSGQGNAKLIDWPEYSWPEGIKVIDIKSRSHYSKDQTSFKEFSVSVVAAEAKSYELLPFQFEIFSPQKQSYVRVQSDPLAVTFLPARSQNVSGGEPKAEKTQTAGNKVQGEEEEPLRLPSPMANRGPTTVLGRSEKIALIFGSYGLVLLLLGLRILYFVFSDRRTKDFTDEINRKISKILGLVRKGNLREAGIMSTDLISTILGETSGARGVEVSKLMQKAPPSVRRELSGAIQRELDFFSTLGFGPETLLKSMGDGKQIKERVLELQKILLRALKMATSAGEGNETKVS